MTRASESYGLSTPADHLACQERVASDSEEISIHADWLDLEDLHCHQGFRNLSNQCCSTSMF